MHVFVLVDLSAQAEFLPRPIRTWPPDRFLSYLRLFGQVEPFPLHLFHRSFTAYQFRASSGLSTSFALGREHRLYILTPRPRQAWGSLLPLVQAVTEDAK